VGHAVKLGGYLSASAAAGGVRHSTVDPSTLGGSLLGVAGFKCL
jgi:hypothetical protein